MTVNYNALKQPGSFVFYIQSMKSLWEILQGSWAYGVWLGIDIPVMYHQWDGEIYGPPNCPTWTDEGGCRCMLAPEEQ